MISYLESLFSLKGKTAIITGAGSSKGIGSDIALAFLKAGANITCVSRSEKPVIKELEKYYTQCDISNFEKFNKVCTKTIDLYGGIDILVNAAAVSLPSDDFSDQFERFNKTVNINLTSTYKCCEIVSLLMSNGGSIINITSIGAMTGFPDNPGYIASKGGLRALTKALAEDFSVKKIRVNNIAPGYIKTNMTKQSFEKLELYNARLDRMIIKRWGEVDDIVGAAIFLASNASSYVTGIDLVIDGGWLAKGL
jgi:NAD(P)-dependent dehydrogenase (short-subunit alcohol dehydrogenase family)